MILAFKEMEKIWPLYGKLSNPPLSPEQWWTELIQRCMKHAGASNEGSIIEIRSGFGH
jgi:hypothetical protein